MLLAELDEPNRPLTNEHHLLAEILSQAIRDLSDTEHLVRKDAREWLEAENERAFSARWICNHLGLDISILRQSIAVSERLNCHYWLRRTLYGERKGFVGYVVKGASKNDA